MAVLVLGGGCFWCLDAAYRLLPGVLSVVSGYAGGEARRPSYQEVCSEKTGHAEVVKIEYDPNLVTRDRLLEFFWKVHDPTQVGGQGHDHGTQYRSVLFYADEAERKAEAAAIAAEGKRWKAPITTELISLEKFPFWPAEEYHQDYFAKNPGQGYCSAVIRPKIEKLKRLSP